MKTSEFNQVVHTVIYLSDKIENLKEILPFVNEIRKYHTKLQVKLEYLLIDQISYDLPTEKESINAIALEIKNLAKEIGIQVVFNRLPEQYVDFSSQFRTEKNFVSYFYNKVIINGLIVFTENKKQIIKKDEEVKKEIKDFTFEIPGNELPALDNIKLDNE